MSLMIKAIFFDAVGTLLHLNGTVGDHYALVAREVGLSLDADTLNRGFLSAWKQMPAREPINGPRDDDDKGWWHELIELMFRGVAPQIGELDRDNFFEVAYEHFAEAGVWQLYPDVLETLAQLRGRVPLAVVSNFDGRLRMILEQLGISKFFSYVFVSSELGADKPHPEIFRRALKFMKLEAREVLHVGDDAERDWRAAEAAGLSVFRLKRPSNSLGDVVATMTGD
jgi:putative hydrolase of the HAD superfamily